MSHRACTCDPISLLVVLLIAYWATFGGGCDDLQPENHTIGEALAAIGATP